MIIQRRFPIRLVLFFGVRFAGLAALWAALVYTLYVHLGLTFIKIPYQPIATIGIAVAFYVGFKNNSAYDRFWEGRKIWGAVVNESRTWASFVINYIDVGDESEKAKAVRRELVYRHLAWINALRVQLRKTSRFFDKPAKGTARRLKNDADHMRNDWDKELRPFFVQEGEFEEVSARKNPATHLVHRQGEVLAKLNREERLDLFHQIDMMQVLRELYTLQGKCERIKNTPFPRQYAEYSRVFVRVFLFLVPFGMLDVFGAHAENASGVLDMVLPALPMLLASALISWVFFTLETIGDASEDPFERSMNDVPMNALCRTIEIDLREMLGEAELPEGEKPAGWIMY